jgi:RNA polymerase sigma-70 factor (ECF subfamily)
MTSDSSLSTWDDLALMYAVQRRDERALAVLYDRHSARTLGLIMRIVPDQAEAESVLLSTFTQVWQSAQSYSPERGPFAAWLVMMARSRALDVARAAGRRDKLMPVSMDQLPKGSPMPAAEFRDPVDDIDAKQRRDRLRRAMHELPEQQRLAIELAFYEGLSHSDVAEKLGEPLGTIKTRIRLGMTKLRAALHNELGEALG